MKESEITSLAREYAEEEYKTLNLPTDHTEVSAYRYMDFARFLLRRFCLVEKRKVKQIFQSKQNILANQDKYDRYIVDEASAEKRLMLCLFPEIAKEVE